MALVLRLLYTGYQRFDAENKDTRTENFFLMNSPLPILAISISYLIFVLKLGPQLMKNRKAFELKYVLMIYNLFQVLANLTLVYMATDLFYVNKKFSEWSCMRTDRSTSPYAIAILRIFHLFYMLKITDFLDTIFFVLRKSYNQITFLHVYHHFGMALGCYIGIRYVSGGQIVILGYLNIYVHVVMYFYYFMSALRPAMKESLWWKKYITQLQIVQFVLNIVHFTAAMIRKDCDHSKLLMLLCVTQNLFVAAMFIDFYIKAYLRKPKLKKTL